MDLKLNGKRALVLAASRGLGFATAMGLAREGTALVICSRDAARIGEAAQKIRAATGARVEAVTADVSSGDEAARLVAHTVATLGGLDIVVHNAGGPPSGPFLSITDAQWHQAFEQNLMSYIRLVQAAVPELKKAGGGRILTIASSSIKQPVPGLVTSNTLRAGIWGLAKTLAKELGPDNILRQRRGAGPHPDRAHRRTRPGDRHPAGRRRGAGEARVGRGDSPRPHRHAGRVRQHARLSRLRRGPLHLRPGDHVDGGAIDGSLVARYL